MNYGKSFSLVFSLGLVTLASPLFAAPITGSFNFGGSSATVAATTLTFNCTNGISGATCPGPAGTGNFNVTGGTGDLAGYVGQGGHIKHLDSTTTPANESFLLTDWLTFSNEPTNPVASPNIALDLQFIYLGSSGQAQCFAAPAAGQTCTPQIPALVTAANPLGLSPYNLQNTPVGSTASFSVAGVARNTDTGELSNFFGTFTAPFDVSYQVVLSQLVSGSISNAYSGTITLTAQPPSEVPEPETVSMLVAGGLLMLVGGIRRRSVNN